MFHVAMKQESVGNFTFIFKLHYKSGMLYVKVGMYSPILQVTYSMLKDEEEICY